MTLNFTENDSESPLRRLTPEAATNYAYDLHDSQDPFASDNAKCISNKALEALYGLTAPKGSREEWFLSQMLSIIVSYGNAITKLKMQHNEERAVAHQYHDMRSDQLTQTQQVRAIYKGIFKVVGAMTVGVASGLITKILALFGYVPDALLNQKGHTDTIVSIAVGVCIFGITGVIQNWWSNYTSNRIDKEYQSLLESSHIRYAQSLLIQLDLNWKKLCAMWQWYTGEEWGEMPAYMRSTRSNLDFELHRSEILHQTTQSNLVQICSLAFKSANAGWALVRKKKTASAQ